MDEGEVQPVLKPIETAPSSKKWLWIGIGITFVILVGIILYLSLNQSDSQDIDSLEKNSGEGLTDGVNSEGGESNGGAPAGGTTSSETSTEGITNVEIDPNSYKSKTVIAYGIEVAQGEPVYNQYNPEECGYSIFFACDVFGNGCDDDGILEYCKSQCIESGGRPQGTGGYARLTDGGVINAVQCSCSQCLSLEGGDKDFEFIETRTVCRVSFGENEIEVAVENTGSSDISKDDWVIHNIDGQEVDVWPFDIKVGEWGEAIRTRNEKYSPGEHSVEIGLSQENVKIIKVDCP